MPALALEFLILIAVRSGEVLSARWSEIDLADKVWTIPAPRMKAANTIPHNEMSHLFSSNRWMTQGRELRHDGRTAPYIVASSGQVFNVADVQNGVR